MSVLPGLWEAHGHLFHVGEADPGAFQVKFADQLVPIMEAVARVTVERASPRCATSARRARARLSVGTALCSSDQKKLRQRILAGEIPGPRLYFSGPALAPRHRHSRQAASTLPRCRKRGPRRASWSTRASTISSSARMSGRRRCSMRSSQSARESGLGVDAEARHIAALDAAARGRRGPRSCLLCSRCPRRI